MFFEKEGKKNLDTIKAVVQKVIREGKHGPFAVATSTQLDGSVTFSLEPTVWEESEWPEEGMMVFLGKLRQKRAGWRAKQGRFWKLSDEQTQQTERSKQMQFLYPTSRQFPFDEVCGKIVRELEIRNWQVPGITVDFHEYGSGEQKFRNVSNIKGPDFKIRFCRKQRLMDGGRYNDIAAVNDIAIPKKEISVYEDESGPTFYLYVGNDWETDREKFFNGSKVNSKLYGEPKMYLEYKGGCDCRATGGASFEAVGFLMAHLTGDQAALSQMHHTHSGRRPPVLVHTNDLNREYDPEGDEPKLFRTSEVMAEFKQYLEEIVLAMIVSHPIPTEKVDAFAPAVAVALPESVGSIFCFGEYRDGERIKQGKEDPTQLQASDRYGMSGGGYRLACLGTPNDGTVPKIAYEGFLWCGIGEVTPETPIDSLEVPGHYRWSDRERFVIRIKPNQANGIYIADHAEYDKRRKEICDAITDGRDRLTDAEVADFTRARARTIIPISEYKGGFGQPIVLVDRELSFDEVEIVSGPHNDRHGR
ncbi:MAG: hypothetical protein ABL917_00365 [Parcubacteria group bacterium]